MTRKNTCSHPGSTPRIVLIPPLTTGPIPAAGVASSETQR